MNIKHISLFSLLCTSAITADTNTITQELNAAKKAFAECQNSKFRFNCNTEKERFKQAKNVFLLPHQENINNAEKASKELGSIIHNHKDLINTPVIGTIYFGYLNHKYVPTILKGYSSKAVKDIVDSSSYYEKSDTIIQETLSKEPEKYTTVNLNQSIFLRGGYSGYTLSCNASEVKAANNEILDLIKKQSETPFIKL